MSEPNTASPRTTILSWTEPRSNVDSHGLPVCMTSPTASSSRVQLTGVKNAGTESTLGSSAIGSVFPESQV